MSEADLADMQGLLRSAYRTLPFARFCLYTLSDPASGRAWLAELAGQVTSAAARAVPAVTQVALTAAGLEAIGVPAELRQQFALEFRDGMAAPRRSRFLGDVDSRDPSTWTWGGVNTARIDVLVASYAATAADLEQLTADLDRRAAAFSATVARELDTSQLGPNEPFGFRDGISDPFVTELASSSQLRHPPPTRVPLGEFVLGYPNVYGQLTQRPGGRADLGRNGSYLVLRTLQQDVDGFHAYVSAAARESGIDAGLLAAKMVGRWPSGAPLTLSPDRDAPELSDANDFGFHEQDAEGLACPIGAHIRRSNPRDSLDPKPGSTASLAVTDRHRLIRRGRKIAGPSVQGLHFLALNANLSRQFEFVQHTWLNNPKFAGLYNDVDPLVAPRDTRSVFTIPDRPVRNRVRDLPDFVTTVGGAYFFLPALHALAYLGEGAW